MRRLIALFLSFVLVSSTAVAAQAEDELPATNTFSVSLTPNQRGPIMSSLQGAVFKSAKEAQSFGEIQEAYICEKFGANPCNSSGKYRLGGGMVAPICEDRESNCILDFYATTVDGKTRAEFLGYVTDHTVAADPDRALWGTGKSASLWRVPGILNSLGSDTYMINVTYRVSLVGNKFNVDAFSASIYPYKEAERLGVSPPDVVQRKNGDGKNEVGFTVIDPENCIYTQTDVCGEIADFPADTRFGIKMRFQNEISSWFQGRLRSPEVAIQKFDSRSKIVDFSGEPVRVPVFKAEFTKEQQTPVMTKFLRDNNIRPQFPGGIGTSSDHEMSMNMVDAFRVFSRDTAAGAETSWFLANIGGGSGPCLSSKSEVLGIVTTNSMAYQSMPPTFSNGFLQYRVAGMHYQPDGEALELGSYDLVMRSSVARCLFNISNVPLSATVSVLNDKGTRTRSTTVISEKNGWLKMAAYNFTFSKKTIKVKVAKKR